ncbi:acetylajmaline esterase [Trifolium repens]|nr:acetylajmaline esterase [Trifolium repens]
MKIIILFCITLTCGFLGNVVSNDNPLPYEAIFNFGDSISDTGNAMKSLGSMPSNSPYGSTYFKHPAGRLSNGRLIIDFIECEDYFKKSLFFVGEIGGNDILSHVLTNKPVTEIRKIVPLMVEEIANTASALIEEGVTELAIPGNFPIGCNAAFLSIVDSKNKEDYDLLGCLIAYNTLAEYFNEQLKNAIDTLRTNNPQAKIIYFDYYNDAKRLYQASQQYGFTSDKNEILKACCGSSAPYNVDVKKPCGTADTAVCSDPSKQINWDGAHLTEAAYRMIAKGLVEGPFANPSLKTPPVKIA